MKELERLSSKRRNAKEDRRFESLLDIQANEEETKMMRKAKRNRGAF